MENELIRKSAEHLVNRMNRYTCKEGLALQKMVLGMEIFLINISKITIVYLLAVLLGVLWQTLVVHIAFLFIKRYSFGLHALNSTACTVISCCMFVVAPSSLSNTGINNSAIIVIFLAIIFVLHQYAPADTKARPLIGAQSRDLLKKKAVACGMIAMLIALLTPSEHIKLLLTLGAGYQCVSILPLTYKILKRSRRNYEAYE